MPAENIIERAFSGGEIAPALYARTDQTKYQQGARTIRNHICMRHGGLIQRPGTMYVYPIQNGFNGGVQLIPFTFNETGLGQSYVLEFGQFYIAFYQNGGVVISAPNTPYTIASPYAQSIIGQLQFDQCADVITITHPDYAPRELRRLGPTNWTLTEIGNWGSARPGPTGLTASGTAGSPNPYNGYFVTSVGADGSESDNSAGSLFASVFTPLAIPTPTNQITLSWIAAPGAVFYRIYSFPVTSQIGAPGYIGQTTNLNFVDSGFVPDFTNAPPLYNQVFAGDGSGLCPTTVAYIQQRRGFANTISNPIGFWLSQSGQFSNFDTHLTSLDSDSIFGSISGGEVNAIEHLTELKFMLMLTAGAEIFVQGNGSGIVTPSAINTAVQSQYGASSLRPLKVGDVLLFNQSLGSFIRDFVFDFVIDGYRGNDITVFSAHLFEGHQIVDWAYQKTPDSIIWAVREDGVLLSCTYVREQQILAWTRHDFTNGFVENVCAIPENGNYAVYVVIRRVINGTTVRYIERISSRIWQGPTAAVSAGTANALGDPIDAPFCDSFSQYDGRNTTAIAMFLTASGGFQTGNTAYQQLLNLRSSSPYFGSGQTAQIGDQIFLEDAAWVSSQGQAGNQVRCTIMSISSSTVAIVTPSEVVPVEFQGIGITLWARAVQTISGLTYLAGQKVSVWADRFVVGSPLNKQISTVYTVSLSGVLTLDKPYSVIYVGLPMVADLETLAIDTSFGDSTMGERKAISRLTIYIYNTRGFFGGTQNPDTDPDNLVSGVVQDPLFNLTENKAEANRQFYSSPQALMTEWQVNNVDCNWSKEGRIFIRNVDPVPLSILAIVPAGLTSAKTAWSQKV